MTVPAGSSARTVTEPELAIGHGRKGSRVLYLAYLEGYDLPTDVDGPWRELVALRPGLLFVDSEQRRSVVYHAIKDHLPPDTPLLVAELTEVPKFKGMARGSLAWARRLPGLDGPSAGS